MASDQIIEKSIKGAAWTYGATLINALGNLIFLAVLARLLEPEVFGYFALIQVTLGFGQYLSQLGLGNALIQKEGLEKEDIESAWALVGGLCLIVFSGFWLLAPLAANYYQATHLAPMIRLAALTLVLQSLAVIPLALLRRRMDYAGLAGVEVTAYLLGYGGVGILLALYQAGVWALIIAQICQYLLTAVLATGRANCPCRPRWHTPAIRHLLSFGSRVTLISFLEFLGANLDVLLMGKYFPKAHIGIYNKGKMLSQLPLYYITLSLGRVLLPMYSRLNTDPHRQEAVLEKGFFLLGALIIPGAAALFIFAPHLVALLLGPRWASAAPVMEICCFGSLFALLSNPLAILCEARARLNGKFIIQCTQLALFLGGFYAFSDQGLTGVALAFFLSQATGFALYLLLTAREFSPRPLIRAMVPSATAAALAAMGTLTVARLPLSPAAVLPIQCLVFPGLLLLIFVSPAMEEHRRLFLELVGQIRTKLIPPH